MHLNADGDWCSLSSSEYVAACLWVEVHRDVRHPFPLPGEEPLIVLQDKRLCPRCGRPVTVLKDGSLASHGPGPENRDGICWFICPGSGDKAMVRAARNLKLPPEKETR